jgi:phosphate transport system permease protein
MIDHSAHVGATEMLRVDAEALVRKAKRSDGRFEIIGLGVLVVTMIVLLSLILDFMVDGLGRINVDFLINYPSRRPEQAGILSAWIGTVMLMVTTAFLAVPLGVGAGVYLEEYAPKNLVTNLIEINVTNLAGVPSIIYGLLALGLFVQTLSKPARLLTGLAQTSGRRSGCTSCPLLGRASSPARSSACRVRSVRLHR